MRSSLLVMVLCAAVLIVAAATIGCGRGEKPSPAPTEKKTGGWNEPEPGPEFVAPEKKVEPEKKTEPVAPQGAVLVGVMVPLSGERQAEGEAFLEGMKLAFAEKAGRTGLTVRSIIAADTGDRAEDVLTRARTLVRMPNVCALAGLLDGQSVEAVDDMARHNELLVLTPVSEPLTLSMLGSTVLRLTVDDAQEGAAAAAFAAKELSAKSAAILVDTDSPASERRARSFAKRFEALGGAAPPLVSCSKDTTNFARSVRLLAQEKPDAVYLPVSSDIATTVLKIVKADQLALRAIGCTDWDIREEHSDLAAAPAGVYAIARFAPDRTGPATQGFIDAYRTSHPDETPGPGVALGYDAGLVIIEAMRTGAATRAEMLAEVRKLQDVPGATQPLTAAEGTLVTCVAVMKLKDGKFILEKMMPVE